MFEIMQRFVIEFVSPTIEIKHSPTNAGIVMVKDPAQPSTPFWPARIISFNDYLELYKPIPAVHRPEKKVRSEGRGCVALTALFAAALAHCRLQASYFGEW